MAKLLSILHVLFNIIKVQEKAKQTGLTLSQYGSHASC